MRLVIYKCPKCGTKNKLPDTIEQRKKCHRLSVYCARCRTKLLDADEVRRKLTETTQAPFPYFISNRLGLAGFWAFCAIGNAGTFGWIYADTGSWFFLLCLVLPSAFFLFGAWQYWHNPPED